MPLSSVSMLLMMVQPDLGQMAGIDDGGVHLSSLIVSREERDRDRYNATFHLLTWRDLIFPFFPLSNTCLLCLVLQ